MPPAKKPVKKEIEQYDHRGKERLNNPPVGLVTPETDKLNGKTKYAYDPHLDPQLSWDQGGAVRAQADALLEQIRSAESIEDAQKAAIKLSAMTKPFLNWASKTEHISFEVPRVSLHVHERIDPRTIIAAVRRRNGTPSRQQSLFEFSAENPPLREAIEFYKHKHNWSNRLIAGDSLLVMNSLLEKEGMAGKVQMIYIDPPYGIRYGSNFQPFVNRREVKDGKDEDLTQEPEMVKAFRDTWELGIHSYLTYLRDRLLLAKNLLTETGSVFVQISDENLHHVRELMDEIFGSKNFVSQISFVKTSGQRTNLLAQTVDYLLWYARDSSKVKYHQPFLPKLPTGEEAEPYNWIHLPDGTKRRMSSEERKGEKDLPIKARRFQPTTLTSQNPGSRYDVEFQGRTFDAGPGQWWKTDEQRMRRLIELGRIIAVGNTLRYVRYIDDFAALTLSANWTDTGVAGYASEKLYVVQTSTKVIQRCMLMATDPGDLVLDPTCGSGTTAFVAEKWGRRWITCDTSRVAIALTKQRLITSLFDYYELAQPQDGVSSGFKYETIPHVTLKSVANNEPPVKEVMYDRPLVDNDRVRVSGPFTLEAVPAPAVTPLTPVQTPQANDATLVRSGATARQSDWRDELLRTGIRGKAGQKVEFSRLEVLGGARWLHADGETRETKPTRVVVSFGPEHAPLEQRQVALAIEEAQSLVPKPKLVIFAAFQFDPEASKDIDETDWPGVTLLKAQMNADLLTEDLKKKRASNESFWLVGQPDVTVSRVKAGADKGRYLVEVNGFDYYNTKSGVLESGGKDKIAMWLLDTDYDGRSLYPRQVFFPLASEKEGWSRLAKALNAEVDEELVETYRGTTSLPFAPGPHKRIAVKIVDDRGIESLKLVEVE